MKCTTAKPVFMIFCGVVSLSANNQNKLPKELSEVYTGKQITVDYESLKFSRIYSNGMGKHGTKEPKGFGIIVYRKESGGDSRVENFDLEAFNTSINTTMSALRYLFSQLGLESVPATLNSTTWES